MMQCELFTQYDIIAHNIEDENDDYIVRFNYFHIPLLGMTMTEKIV